MKGRSPLNETPLPIAGESVDKTRRDRVLDHVLFPSVIAIFATVLWIQDLWRSYRDYPPNPWLTGILAAIAIGYAAWRIPRALRESASLRLGSQGERAVGQGLEKLRGLGYAVYHDVDAGGFNIDHVLIGPGGVFTVETKTRTKPHGRRAEVFVDGESLTVDGLKMDRDPVVQARAQAAWLAGFLKKSTGRDFPVHPVVVFPGWWIEERSKPRDLWIVNDKALPKYVRREGTRLTLEDISMACTHLEAYLRSLVNSK